MIPNKISQRLSLGIKRFQPILASARSRDLGEADTVTLVTDMLSEIFGYDKYTEITGEYLIRSTFCDLAIKINSELQTLIEVKAIGLELKDNHVRQAIDYAANQGVDWVMLTNGINWRVYKITFAKPIDYEMVLNIDLCQINFKKQQDLELIFLLCKEGWVKSVLGDYHVQKQALSRFFLGSIILTDSILQAIRKELKRLSPDVKITTEQIAHVLTSEVIKREVMEGDKADEAKKKISRALNKAAKSKNANAVPQITKVSSDQDVISETD